MTIDAKGLKDTVEGSGVAGVLRLSVGILPMNDDWKWQ